MERFCGHLGHFRGDYNADMSQDLKQLYEFKLMQLYLQPFFFGTSLNFHHTGRAA